MRIMPKHYTEEQRQFIVTNYPLYDPRDFVEMFNKKFGTNKRNKTLVKYANYLGLSLTKDAYSEMCRNSSNNRRAKIGDVSIYKNGRAYMKTENGWREASIVVWEKEHGKIPDGFRAIYLDGDTTNYSLDNIAIVTKEDLGVIASLKIASGNPEVVKTAIMWCELYHKLGMTHKDLRNYRRKCGCRVD